MSLFLAQTYHTVTASKKEEGHECNNAMHAIHDRNYNTQPHRCQVREERLYSLPSVSTTSLEDPTVGGN